MMFVYGRFLIVIIRKEGRHMDERELPEPGPLPESGGSLPAPGAPDPEWDAYAAWREREIAAGRDEEPPPPWEIEGPAVSLSLGDAAVVDPALLAAICGPDGLGGDALGPQFGQDAAADVLLPGPVLAALTEQAADDLSRLTDNQLIGALHAGRRLENRAYYLQTRAIAEFARRRTGEFETAIARGVPAGCRSGEFPGAELAAELLVSRVEAGHRIDAAAGLAARLPKTLQGMSAGLIDAERAATIAAYTASLSPEDAALADEILAAAAPQVRAETLARRAAALEMKLDPQAATDRRERARRTAQRVEVRRERSGNASVSGRELGTADAMASKANIHALALRLRRAGAEGTLDHLRAMVFNDLLQGRNPLDRTAPVPEAPAADEAQAHDTPGDTRGPEGTQGPEDDWDPADDPLADAGGDAAIGSWPAPGDDSGRAGVPGSGDHDDDAAAPDTAGASVPACPPAPMPAVINLLVPAGTLFGWDTTPSDAGGWGLLGPGETRDIVRAASMHPQTRWCMTVTGPDGTAIAHGCSPGQHPWTPENPPAPAAPPDPPDPDPPDPDPPAPPRQQNPSPPDPANPPASGAPADLRHGAPAPGARPRQDGPDAGQAAQLAALLRRLNIALEPIARRTCDHGHAEDHYKPSRKLQHLVRARTATCTAPGCQAQAIHADLDHTIPYPDGPTDECNIGPKCRHDHRVKQAPDWHVEQPEPGIFRWTLPSGRTHTTRPTIYDI